MPKSGRHKEFGFNVKTKDGMQSTDTRNQYETRLFFLRISDRIFIIPSTKSLVSAEVTGERNQKVGTTQKG